MNVFENESDAITIGGLSIENRLDRISIYGSLDLTRDKQGLQQALALKEIFDAVVFSLSSGELPEHIEIDAPTVVANPFDSQN